MQKIYLITGILGHLGSTIARELLSQGASIRGFDLKQVVHNDLQKQKDNCVASDRLDLRNFGNDADNDSRKFNRDAVLSRISGFGCR